MHRVRGVILRAMSSGSMHNVFGSMSAKTTVAPMLSTGVHEAQYVADGQMTSSPQPTPQPKNAPCSAAVPVLCASPYFIPCHSAYATSNSWPGSVLDICPLWSMSSRAFSSRSSMTGCTNMSPGSAVTAFGPPLIASSLN